MTHELQPGSSFGDYVLERRLGGGGFGDVWLARNAAGGLVALKVLFGQYQSGEAAKLRAEIELLAAAASSRSTHIVRVLGGGSEPLPYVVMEYIDGVDLAREIMRRGALPVEEVLHIAEGIADALATLQQAGIIHRDIKPANVMIDTQGVVKLTDFGIAKIVGLDTVTATSQTPMSMAYAAPEVWEGQASHVSDHYAFGALLYQCLCGRPVFNGSYAEIYNHHRLTAPDLSALPDTTPSALRELIDSCLAKETAKRPQTADALLAAIHAARDEIDANLDRTVMVVRRAEPKTLGPWLIDARSPDGDWTFVCHHESSGEKALVEVHFSDELDYGQALRRAVAASPSLVPLGAERLLGTSRLVLRPGENWHEAPSANFLFWVAREGPPDGLPAEPGEISVDELKAVTQSLQALMDTAGANGLRLDLRAGNLVLKADGSLYIRRPGLAPFPETDQITDAMAFLSSIPLKPATSVSEPAPPPTPAPPPVPAGVGPPAPSPSDTLSRPGPRPVTIGSWQTNIYAVGAIAAVLVLAVVAVLALSSGGGSKDGGKAAAADNQTTPSTTGTATISAHILAANSAVTAKDYATAIREYTQILAIDPKSTYALYGRGTAYQTQNKNDLALADYNKVIEIDPKDARYYVSRGDIYRAQTKGDLARADYNKAIELDSRNAGAFQGRALVSEDAKSWDAAIADYSKVIELNPRSAFAFNHRGWAYKNQGKYDQALVDNNKAIELDPKYSYAYAFRGEVYQAQGKRDPAWVDYSKAIELDANNTYAYFDRGLLSINFNYYDGALADFTKVLALTPTDPSALNNRGIAYAGLKQYDLAIADYNKSIQLEPNGFNAWRNRGIAYQAQGRSDLARSDFEKAKSLAKTPDEMQRAQASLDGLK